ncbi:MAG: hypothetical protein Kow0098_18750 [Ignavibacteriaceae bacterium]
MQVYDLAISYVWEYDEDFVDLIEQKLQSSGISTYIIKEHNIREVTESVARRELSFRNYLDRASDADTEFEELGSILTRRKTQIINPYRYVKHAIDKASMHLEFITAGLLVPYSIIIPPHSEIEELYISIDDLQKLGRPFIIKPCNTTGGGIGVVTGAETLKDILRERITNSEDKYLLQEKIYPGIINGRRAWFRCFWAFGQPLPCWWDDFTHIYDSFSGEEKKRSVYKKLCRITKRIAELTKLDFFSTEIVLTHDKKFIVIDYVNDQCDMRFQSKYFDGVPDKIVIQIINNLKRMIIRNNHEDN